MQKTNTRYFYIYIATSNSFRLPTRGYYCVPNSWWCLACNKETEVFNKLVITFAGGVHDADNNVYAFMIKSVMKVLIKTSNVDNYPCLMLWLSPQVIQHLSQKCWSKANNHGGNREWLVYILDNVWWPEFEGDADTTTLVGCGKVTMYLLLTMTSACSRIQQRIRPRLSSPTQTILFSLTGLVAGPSISSWDPLTSHNCRSSTIDSAASILIVNVMRGWPLALWGAMCDRHQPFPYGSSEPTTADNKWVVLPYNRRPWLWWHWWRAHMYTPRCAALGRPTILPPYPPRSSPPTLWLITSYALEPTGHQSLDVCTRLSSNKYSEKTLAG